MCTYIIDSSINAVYMWAVGSPYTCIEICQLDCYNYTCTQFYSEWVTVNLCVCMSQTSILFVMSLRMWMVSTGVWTIPGQCLTEMYPIITMSCASLAVHLAATSLPVIFSAWDARLKTANYVQMGLCKTGYNYVPNYSFSTHLSEIWR